MNPSTKTFTASYNPSTARPHRQDGKGSVSSDPTAIFTDGENQMGMSVTKWRLNENEFSRGPDYLENRFNAAQGEEEWGEGSEFSNFCEIGEVWDLMNLAISGERFPTQGVESLVILGGDMLREIDEPGGMITTLTQQDVFKVSQLLTGFNIDSLVARCDQFERLPDFVINEIRQKLADLQSHYTLAAREGQIVVTRIYGP
ncbi:DUF1877 family protein [Streptomyces sp. NPDC092359]|uniref:DUF1877 family protein n=1 Tax=Streptomyces sp. NPDC092359 TaxID=3366014 RepID=UPI003813CA6C